MANVKLGDKTFEGVESVKLDTTDGSTVVFTEQSGGGAMCIVYDSTKEYEVDEIGMYKVSDIGLSLADLEDALFIVGSSKAELGIFTHLGGKAIVTASEEGVIVSLISPDDSAFEGTSLFWISTNEFAAQYGIPPGIRAMPVNATEMYLILQPK